MCNDITLKKAYLSNLPGIIEVEYLCFGEDSFSPRQLRYLIRSAKGVFYTLCNNDKVVATLSLLYHSGSHNLRIYSIAVHPDYRHKRLGQRLIDAALSYAKEYHAIKITLEVNVSNTVAIKLYEKNGFIKKGIKSAYYSNGNDAFYMVYPL